MVVKKDGPVAIDDRELNEGPTASGLASGPAFVPQNRNDSWQNPSLQRQIKKFQFLEIFHLSNVDRK